MAVWTKQTTPADATDRLIHSIGTTVSNNNRYSLSAVGNGSFRLNARTTADVQIASATSYNDTNWHCVVGVFASATDRRLYVDTIGSLVTDTNSSAPSATNRMRIGGNFTTPNMFYNGYIALPAVWNAALDTAEVRMLLDRFPALRVRRQSLVWYSPYFGRETNDINIIGATNIPLLAGTAPDDGNEPPVNAQVGERRTTAPLRLDTGIPDPGVGRQHTTINLREISAITAANPAVVTYTPNAETLATDQLIRIYGVTGTMSAVNATGNEEVGNLFYYRITVIDPTSFSINGLDTTGLSYTSGGVVSAGRSVLENANPPAVDGDVLDFPSMSNPGSYGVTVRPDGGFSIDSGADDSRQILDDVKFWDVSLAAYSDDPGLDIYVNNHVPTFTGSDTYFHTRGVAITPINLVSQATDIDSGDVVVVTAISTVAAGYLFSNPNLSGTPDTVGQFLYTFRWTDQAGDFFERVIVLNVAEPSTSTNMTAPLRRASMVRPMVTQLVGPMVP
jgi:hypothetical protein